MAHHPRAHSKRTARQIAASRRRSAAGRAAAAKKKRTAKQIAAAKHNLHKARIVKKTIHHHHHHHHHHSGHATVHKKAKAPMLDTSVSLHSLSVCAPVAFAEHLFWQTGVVIPDEQIIAVYREVGDLSVSDLAEYCHTNGFAGYRLDSFTRCDESLFVPGLVYGVSLSVGYHAVLSTPVGLISWGMALPLIGVPHEAWDLQWSHIGVPR